MEENSTQYNIHKIFSNIGFLFLSICGGILTGVMFGVIGSFIYLIIVFPVIMGVIGGAIINGNAKSTKTRNAFLITLSSALTVIALICNI